jgi:hypothetical protein
MAQPASLVERLVLQATAEPLQNPLQHEPRQLHAGLAIRRGGDGQLSQRWQGHTGGIAMKTLDEKALTRDTQIKQPLSPPITGGVASALDGVDLKPAGPILLKRSPQVADGRWHR